MKSLVLTVLLVLSTSAFAQAKIDWARFYERLQVLDIENQMSCTGHALARSWALRNPKVRPSPEFLYDVGASYFGILKKLEFPIKPWAKLTKEESSERMAWLREKFDEIRDAKKTPPGATLFILDFASTNGVLSRDEYDKHFSAWDPEKLKRVELKFETYPPFDDCLAGKAFDHYETLEGRRLTPKDGFESTRVRLAKFDLGRVDKALKDGFFPVLDLNTDSLVVDKDKAELTYSNPGGNGHSLVVVGKENDFYLVLDSWADEKMKALDSTYVMKPFKIHKDNLQNKVNLITIVR